MKDILQGMQSEQTTQSMQSMQSMQFTESTPLTQFTPTWQRSWQALIQHQQGFTLELRELFSQNKHRFKEFSLKVGELLFDYSKQRVQEETLALLIALADASLLEKRREALFSGEKINHSEDRAVLHTALRDLSERDLSERGLSEEFVNVEEDLNENDIQGSIKKNIKTHIQDVLARLETFSNAVHQQHHRGASSLPFTHVICLGIGGSELGPRLLNEALSSYKISDLQFYFLSNIDPHSLATLLEALDPLQTLCIISSKTFTTLETLHNAKVIKEWFKTKLLSLEKFQEKTLQDKIAQHLVAVTANPRQAQAFGIKPEFIFEFWDWVGGRFSIWSAVGLPALLALGMPQFKEFLAGAHEMDLHFQNAPLRHNMPVLMALVGIWNINFLGYHAHAIIPYDDRLHSFPAYLQQLEMESNGKSVGQNGQPLPFKTAPIVWGGVGCNGQHAFMQLLHQGTHIVPVDFLIGIQGAPNFDEHQKLLVANCLGQSKALMEGDKPRIPPLNTNMENVDKDNEVFKTCLGNRPSSTLMYPKLTPRVLGNLLALYEHKVFVQGVMWGINSFDQWGVELGKTLAKTIYNTIEKKQTDDPKHQTNKNEMDSSTQGLIDFFQSHF